MAASYNKVILVGNLTRDPQLKYLPGASQTAVTEISLAVNRRYRTQDGQQQEEVSFVDCTAFGRQAETMNQYLSKGRPVLIEGRLKQDRWEAKDGSKRSKLQVVIERFQFLGGGGSGGSGGGGEGYRQGSAPQRGGQRPQQAPPQSGPDYPDSDYGPAGGGGYDEPQEDDIPF